MIGRRMLLLTAAMCLGFAVQAQSQAQAQAYPEKPIRVVVPFPPGGPIDTMARLVADQMTKGLGQQVVIDNRPGAGSTIATKVAAAAEPDGYTLLFGSSGSLGTAPALYPKANIEPLKMFVPVASVALLPMVMVVPVDVPAKTVAEFIAHAKANPGKLNYGAGLGTPPHLLSALFVSKANVDITFVPYKGAAQSITDLLAARTQFTIDGTVSLMPHIRSGKLRAIGMARPERWPELPNVPTMKEQGFPDLTIDAWAGLVAPAGTSPQIVAKLNAAVNAGLKSAEVKAALDRFSSVAKIGSPDDFRAFIESEAPRWAALVKASGAKVE
jgi:tripartite-type tricarboxylate transporter receptor subunit TctC